MTASPQIRYTLTGVVVRFPYDAAVVESLKWLVPARSRRWDPSEKVWTVDTLYADQVIRLLRSHFGEVVIDDEYTATTPIRPTDRDFAALHLLPSAPPALVTAAYKVLAKTIHPDTGGDTSLMQRLNEAYSALRDRGAA